MPNQSFSIKITKKGKDPSDWINDIDKRIYPELQAELDAAGKATAIYMKQIIKSSIKREGSTGKLENSIESETVNVGQGVHVMIGKISDLPIYWEVIDEGGYIPPANIGTFDSGAPVAGKTGERWNHTGGQEVNYGFDQLYLMTPKKAIEPVRYVNIANELLISHIKKMINKFMKNIEKSGKSTGGTNRFGAVNINKWGTKVTFGGPGSASGGAK